MTAMAATRVYIRVGGVGGLTAMAGALVFDSSCGWTDCNDGAFFFSSFARAGA